MNDFSVGHVVVRVNDQNPTARIVHRVLAVYEDESGEKTYNLEALYFGKRFANLTLREDPDGYRLATEGDHKLAKSYADRFNHQDSKE